jgi:hypothetical protein
MLKVELIGPSSDGMVHVHAKGCRDVPPSERGRWLLEGESIEAIGRAETNANYCGEVDLDNWPSWLRVMPCTKAKR